MVKCLTIRLTDSPVHIYEVAGPEPDYPEPGYPEENITLDWHVVVYVVPPWTVPPGQHL